MKRKHFKAAFRFVSREDRTTADIRILEKFDIINVLTLETSLMEKVCLPNGRVNRTREFFLGPFGTERFKECSGDNTLGESPFVNPPVRRRFNCIFFEFFTVTKIGSGLKKLSVNLGADRSHVSACSNRAGSCTTRQQVVGRN